MVGVLEPVVGHDHLTGHAHTIRPAGGRHPRWLGCCRSRHSPPRCAVPNCRHNRPRGPKWGGCRAGLSVDGRQARLRCAHSAAQPRRLPSRKWWPVLCNCRTPPPWTANSSRGLTGGSRSSSCRTGCTAAARPPFRPPPRGRRTSSRSTPCARRAPTGAARPLEQRRAVLEELFREHWPTAPWALCPRRPPSTAPGTLHGSCRSSASDRAQQCKLDHQIPLKSRSADGPCRVRVLYPCVRSPSRMSASMWGARSSGLDAARHSAPVSWRKSPGSASGRMLPSFLPASRSWVIAAMTGP